MKMSGQRNKKLSGFISVHGAPLTAGMKLFPDRRRKKRVRLDHERHAEQATREGNRPGLSEAPFPPTRYNWMPLIRKKFWLCRVRVEIVDLPFIDTGS